MKPSKSPASFLYRTYTKYVWPRIENKRGSFRAKKLLRKLSTFNMNKVSSQDPRDILESEWQNIIILDACRHDLYEEVNGETESRITRGSCTKEFVEKNFPRTEFKEMVCINGQPQLSDEMLKKRIGTSDVFHTKFDTFASDWENGITDPEAIVRDVRTANRLYPDKKKFIHIVHPHHPFRDERIQSDEFVESKPDEDVDTVWDKAEKGEFKDEEIWKAYRENLEYIMPYVEEIVEELEGKTVITSDHGNLVGENWLYAHPCGSSIKELRKVPWDERN